MRELEQHLAAQVSNLTRFENFFWHKLRSEYAISAIRRYVRPHPTVLDIGAGAGVFGSHFQEAFPDGQYAFVEPLETLARNLRSRFMPAADWNNKSYLDADAVVLLDVLEHWEQDVISLKSLTARLPAATILVITSPALPFLWSEWDVKLGHFRRYTARGFRNVLGEAGLEILVNRYLFQTMALVGLVRKFQKLSSSAFPEISDTANGFIYGLGKIERALCSWMPFGSSVAAVCRTQP